MGRFEEAQQALRSLAESVMSSLVSANDEVSKAESICSAIESGREVNPGTGEEFRRVTISIGIRVEVNPPPDSTKVVGQ